MEGLPCDAVDFLFRILSSLFFDWPLRRQTTMTMTTTEMTKDDAEDRMTINRRCDVSSDLSLMELSSFCLSDTCMSSNLVLGWILYTSVDTCTSNPLSVVPMKFASVANIVKRYNRKMYVWNELIFYKTWILTMFAASLRHVTLILCAIAHIYTLVAIWRIGTHRYTVWSNPSWFTSYEKSHRLTEKFCT